MSRPIGKHAAQHMAPRRSSRAFPAVLTIAIVAGLLVIAIAAVLMTCVAERMLTSSGSGDDQGDAGITAPADGNTSTQGPEALTSPDGSSGQTTTDTRDLLPVVRETTYSRVTLSAVGDNLMHMPVVDEADANAGTIGDGWYDFTPMYAGVSDILATHDLNFIDIETILGGDYLGLSGYPVFNSPAGVAENVVNAGWNLSTTATNHSWDMGFEGILNSSATWSAYPQMLTTGTFVSAEDRSTIRVTERDGIRFAFLAYTDSLNGYVLPDDQKWAVAEADVDAMTADVERARNEAGADVVIVAMSWGDENSTTPNDLQRYYAQHLANLGVDLVLGFGPHVIQPIEWVPALDVNGNETGDTTLVVYSLGNFLSNQPLAIENVEGCFTCAFERVGDSGEVELVDPMWPPLVNHVSADSGWHQVFKLKDYTYDLAYAHQSLGTEADPIEYARQLTLDIIGPSGVTIDM